MLNRYEALEVTHFPGCSSAPSIVVHIYQTLNYNAFYLMRVLSSLSMFLLRGRLPCPCGQLSCSRGCQASSPVAAVVQDCSLFSALKLASHSGTFLKFHDWHGSNSSSVCMPLWLANCWRGSRFLFVVFFGLLHQAPFHPLGA